MLYQPVSALFIPEFVLLIAGPLLLLPTGRLPSPRWRWVGVSAATGVGLAMMSMLLAPGYIDDDVPARGNNPLGVEALDGVTDMIAAAGLVLVLASLLMGVAAVAVRLVRYQGARRRQMWWFLGGIAPLLVGLAFDPGSSATAQTVAALVTFAALLGGMGWALLGSPARAVHDEETETRAAATSASRRADVRYQAVHRCPRVAGGSKSYHARRPGRLRWRRSCLAEVGAVCDRRIVRRHRVARLRLPDTMDDFDGSARR